MVLKEIAHMRTITVPVLSYHIPPQMGALTRQRLIQIENSLRTAESEQVRRCTVLPVPTIEKAVIQLPPPGPLVPENTVPRKPTGPRKFAKKKAKARTR